MDSLKFLADPPTGKPGPLYVVHGDEDFLKRRVLKQIRLLVLGPEADDFALSVLPGDKVTYAVVMDDLQTAPFFGPRRLVVVESADNFVSKHRAILEKAIERLPSTGTLVLEVKTWQSTTRLAKMVKDSATIACKTPPTAKLPAWCIDWTKANQGKQLTHGAAELLVQLVGQDMGLLHQELEKLSVFVGSHQRISEEDVDKLVGRSQAENTWKIFDAIGQGNSRGALDILHRLLEQGDDPMRIIGAFRLQLQRLAQAGRLAQHGMSLSQALEQVGVQPFFLKGFQQQLKHLGPERVSHLYDWLLGINMDLRGDSKLSPRTLLERLVIRLARRG